MKKLTHRTALLVFAVLTTANLTASGQDDEVSDTQKKLEDAFMAQLSNTTLVGSFTIDGNMDAPLKPERYEIESVTKVAGNLWTFLTRIKYGKTDARLPVTVPVVWADDTAMVCLTNASIPGMGDQFSARVIFHGNRYAGTWQHGAKGGHMFGLIEKSKPKEEAKESAKKDKQ